MWHFETDPRFDDIAGQTALDATVHYVLGGPEDRCGGGNLRVTGNARLSALRFIRRALRLGRCAVRFPLDRSRRDVSGASISMCRASPCARVAGTLIGSLGMRQGGKVYGHFVGSAVPLSRLDALPALLRGADGQLSAVAEVGGTVDALEEPSASGRMTPVRVGRATHQVPSSTCVWLPVKRDQKVVGTTRCGKRRSARPSITPRLRRRTLRRAYFTRAPSFFGGQLKFWTILTFTRQRNKVSSMAM